FGEADGNKRLSQLPPLTNVDYLAVQPRRLPANGRPQLLIKRIVHHTYQGFMLRDIQFGTSRPWALDRLPHTVLCRSGPWSLCLQSNRHTRMRNSIGEIDRPIYGIHHPALRGFGITGDAFLAQQREAWETCPQNFADQLLTTNVQFQFDVMLVRRVDSLGGAQVPAHQAPGGPGRFDSAGQGPLLFSKVHDFRAQGKDGEGSSL